jgi:hypothetical protein
MKKPLYTALFLALVFRLSGQAALIPDTLLIQDFEDPEFQNTLFTEPSGDDAFWVNYDEDGLQGDCVDDDLTPGGWYRESDLGDGPNTENFVFSSCSYLEDPDLPVKNWLITPPIALTDAGYVLRWKSMSYYGPSLMDGYRVLVSTASNFPTDFTHVIFQAAEFLGTPNPDLAWTLQVSNHVYSPGWIHADAYTDTSAFFLDYEDGAPFYHGKLDAHSVSLARPCTSPFSTNRPTISSCRSTTS